MSFIDVKIILICFVMFGTLGIFNYLLANSQTNTNTQLDNTYNENYTSPSSTNFFSTVNTMISFQFDNPELIWINVILFGALSAIAIFIGLRFLRGTG